MAEESKSPLPTCPACGAHFTPGDGYCWMCKDSLQDNKTVVSKRPKAGGSASSKTSDHTTSEDLKKVLMVLIPGIILVLIGLNASPSGSTGNVTVLGVLMILGLFMALQIAIWEEKDGRRRRVPLSLFRRIGTVLAYLVVACFAGGAVIAAVCGGMLSR